MTTFLVICALGFIAYLYLRGRTSTPSPSIQGHLPGPGTYDFDIVGESKYQDALESICGGRTEESAEHLAMAFLYLEDSNPYDNMAVRVEIDGLTVGYLSRDNARSYRAQLKQLGQERIVCRCNAKEGGGWRPSRADPGHFGGKRELPGACALTHESSRSRLADL